MKLHPEKTGDLLLLGVLAVFAGAAAGQHLSSDRLSASGFAILAAIAGLLSAGLFASQSRWGVDPSPTERWLRSIVRLVVATALLAALFSTSGCSGPSAVDFVSGSARESSAEVRGRERFRLRSRSGTEIEWEDRETTTHDASAGRGAIGVRVTP